MRPHQAPRPAVPATFPTILLALALSIPAAAQDDAPELGWSDTAELTFVLAGGNAETSTLGLTNTLKHTGEEATFTLEAEALRAESTTVTRTAIGTSEAFAIEETETTELTAERFRLAGLYDREITERLFWNVGLEGLRNELAGIDSRWVAQAGIGQVLVDREGASLKTRYAATWTREEDVSGREDDFAGLRLGAEYERALNDATTFGGSLVVDENLDDTSDLRGDWHNWIAVSMSERLALKVGLRLLYDAQPALVDVPLVGPDSGALGSVAAELDELDTLFKTALIVTF